MSGQALADKAKRLRELHADGVLVLANAWDAASAGVAWSLGRRDGEQLSRGELIGAIERIAGVVEVPLTADVEAGYGAAPEDVAGTVTAVLGAGAVGINLEDAPAGGSGQAAYTITRQLAEELLTAGQLTAEFPWLGYGQLNSLIPAVHSTKR